jgi:hypothetical protein
VTASPGSLGAFQNIVTPQLSVIWTTNPTRIPGQLSRIDVHVYLRSALWADGGTAWARGSGVVGVFRGYRRFAGSTPGYFLASFQDAYVHISGIGYNVLT